VSVVLAGSNKRSLVGYRKMDEGRIRDALEARLRAL
jgi:hypothetical protein